MTLDDLRNDIDRVDEVLVRLLNERARCVCEIGRLKKETNMAIYQPDREKKVLAHVRAIAYRQRADALLIDPTTLKHLEIVEGSEGGRDGSLLEIGRAHV